MPFDPTTAFDPSSAVPLEESMRVQQPQTQAKSIASTLALPGQTVDESSIAMGTAADPALTLSEILSGMMPEGKKTGGLETILDVGTGAARGMAKAIPGVKEYGAAHLKLGDKQTQILRDFLKMAGMEPVPEYESPGAPPAPQTTLGKIAEPVAEYGTRIAESALLSSVVPGAAAGFWPKAGSVAAKAVAGELPYVHKGVQDVQAGGSPSDAILEGIMGLGLQGMGGAAGATVSAMRAAKLSRGLTGLKVGETLKNTNALTELDGAAKAVGYQGKIKTLDDVKRFVKAGQSAKAEALGAMGAKEIQVDLKNALDQVSENLYKNLQKIPQGEIPATESVIKGISDDIFARSPTGSLPFDQSIQLRDDLMVRLAKALTSEDVAAQKAYGTFLGEMITEMQKTTTPQLQAVLQKFSPVDQILYAFKSTQDPLRAVSGLPRMTAAAKKVLPYAAAAGGIGGAGYYGAKGALEALMGSRATGD